MHTALLNDHTVLQIQLTSAIDNVWLVASERAKAAGKEMAKVGLSPVCVRLLQPSH
jgi:hypothetical protein